MLSSEKTVKNFQTVQDMTVQEVTGIAFGYMQAISEAKERWGPEFDNSPASVQDFVLALEAGVSSYKGVEVVVAWLGTTSRMGNTLTDKITRKQLRQCHEFEIARCDDQYEHLKADHVAEVARYEADLHSAKVHVAVLREELAKANRAWSKARTSEATARAQLVERTNQRDVAEGELEAAEQALGIEEMNSEGAYLELDDAKAELKELRALLSRVRAAEEPLHRALYPEAHKAAVKPPTGLGWATLPVPSQQFEYVSYNHVGANYDPDPQTDPVKRAIDTLECMTEDIDRPHGAGYSCATGKVKQAEAAGYAGLS